MKEMSMLDKRQSELFDAVRFPLIVLVVFAHSLGFDRIDVTTASAGWNAYHFVSEMISHNLCKLAVCWFYVISGYFFFYTLKDGGFSFDWVLGKWKKRVRSLLIPYFIWNFLIVALSFIKNWAFLKFGLAVDDDASLVINKDSIVYWLWSGPADFPLYFMRDLMILSLFAPLWYLVVKKFKWLSLISLVLLYASPLNPSIPAMRAIFFFLSGAWLGIWKINLLSICRKLKLSAALLSVALLLVATYFNSSGFHEWLLRAFYPFGMIAFMNICDGIATDQKRRDRMISLSGAVFFIYASHEIFILGWTKGLFLRVLGDGLAASWVSYFCVPVVVICVCVILYSVLNRIMPRTLAFVCGGRAKKR